MANREKELTIALLTERIQNITGKKVKLVESTKRNVLKEEEVRYGFEGLIGLHNYFAKVLNSNVNLVGMSIGLVDANEEDMAGGEITNVEVHADKRGLNVSIKFSNEDLDDEVEDGSPYVGSVLINGATGVMTVTDNLSSTTPWKAQHISIN